MWSQESHGHETVLLFPAPESDPTMYQALLIFGAQLLEKANTSWATPNWAGYPQRSLTQVSSKQIKQLFLQDTAFVLLLIHFPGATNPISDLWSANPKTQDVPGSYLPFHSVFTLKVGFLEYTKHNLPLNWLGGFKNSNGIDGPSLSQCPSQTWTYSQIDWKWPGLILKLLPETRDAWTLSGMV